MKVNQNYQNLEDSYLFSTIARKVAEYGERNPGAKIIRLGIGDVTLPLAPAVIDAMQQALCEMSVQESFRGYGPEQGYSFLKDEIQEYYARRGTMLDADEIFISDGAKSDLGNILDLFDVDNTVLIPDPVYPVYVDTNVMAGRSIVFMDANAENGSCPCPTRRSRRTSSTCARPTTRPARPMTARGSRPGSTTPTRRTRLSSTTRRTRLS